MHFKELRIFKKITAVILSAAIVVTAVPQTQSTVYATQVNEDVSEEYMQGVDDSDVEVSAEMQTETEQDSATAVKPEADTQVNVETEVTAKAENETETEAQTGIETEVTTEIDTETNIETEVEVQTSCETETESETDTQAKTETEVTTETVGSIETEVASETELETEMITETESEELTKIDVPFVNSSVFKPIDNNNEEQETHSLSVMETVYEVTEAPVKVSEGVYRIDNKNQFISFLATNEFKSSTINLNCNIDMKGELLYYDAVFSGVFNGNGYSINNALVEQGMFYCVEAGGEVKNLHISNVLTTGELACGVVAYENEGIISNCVVTGNLSSNEKRRQTAGIVADNGGTITNCVFAGNITATSETDGYGKTIGAIAGKNSGTIEKCYSLGSIETNAATIAGIVADNSGLVKDCSNYMKVSGAYDIGGVTAENNRGSIQNCYNYGEIIQKDSDKGQAGGISAVNKGNIADSFNYGIVTGNGLNISGIAGSSSGEIKSCGNYGTITGFANTGGIAGLYDGAAAVTGCFNKGTIKGIGNIDTAIAIGGIVGAALPDYSVSITNSYNSGAIITSDITKYIGGISGVIYKGSITNCYNAGNISALEDNYVAMISGFLGEAEVATYTNCMFLDTDNNEIEYICYRESGVVTDDTARKTQEDLKASAELLGTGFMADSEGINNGYPIVSGQTGEKYSYPVVYELNGGKLDNYFSIVNKNEAVAAPQEPVKKNAYFLGWYTDATLNTAYDFSKGVDSARVIYAKWDSYTAVEDFDFVNERVTLVIGEDYQIKASFTPEDARNTELIWSSDNAEVASVSENGTVIAHKAGQATITARLKDGTLSKEADFIVTVTSESNVIRIKDCENDIEVSTLRVAVNDPKMIQAVFGKTPSNEARLEWQSSNPDCVKVTKNTDSIYGAQAKIEALKPGKSTVTVTMTDGNVPLSAFIEVTVLPLATNVYIKLDNENVNDKTTVFDLVTQKFISVGENKLENPTDTLLVSVSPSDAGQKVKWQSDSQSVIKFEDEKSGKATGNREGTAKITATAADGSGIKGTATVKTKRIAQALKLVPQEVSKETPVVKDENGYIILTTGNSIKLLTEFTPVDVTNERVSWSISDKEAIEIDPEKKIVTAKKVAEDTRVTVKATALDEGEASCEIKFVIKPQVEEIKIYKTTDLNNPVNDSKIGVHPDKVDQMQFSLVVKNSPENSSQVVTWKSSNTKVATIQDNKDGSCNITIKGKGQSVITATAADGSGVTATTTINVSSLVTGIEIIGGNMVMKGKTITLKTQVAPKSATNKDIIWESLTPDYAAVEKNTGKVTGLKAGVAIIRATAADGGGASTLHTIIVTDKIESLDIIIPDNNENTEDDVVMTGKSIGIDPDTGDNTYVLASRVLPKTACQIVEWKSSNEKVATVDENGVVTAVGLGNATIVARSTDGSGKSASVNLFVTTLVRSIEISGSHYVGAKKSIQLTAEVGDKDAADKTVIWSSEHPDIAIVDETGKVTAVAETGNVTITAEAADGSGIKDEHKIFILKKPNDIEILSFDNDCTIDKDNSDKKSLDIDMSKNESVRFIAEISGGSDADADYPKQIIWTTSNEKIAALTTENVGNEQVVRVIFLDEGTVTLTAKAADGTESKDSIKINIENTNPKVQITGPTQVAKGKKINLSAGNTEVEWQSSDTSIATVNSKGQVKGKAEGSVEITAKAVNGTNEDIITVNVGTAVKKVEIYLGGNNVTKQNIGFDLVKKYSDSEIDLEAMLDGTMSSAVTWKSNKTSVVAVDEDGKLDIKKSGKATITATATDGSGKKATVTITIAKQVTQITAADEITDINLAYKKSLQLKLNYKPLAATTKKAVWTSSHPKVVSVNKNSGKITAKKNADSSYYPSEGYVTITATAADNGGAKCQFRVYVTTPVKTVSVVKEGQDYTSIVGLEIDNEQPVLKLSANLFDKNKESVGVQKVTWKSDNEKIAKVDDNGLVTGINTGKAVITATATDGTKKSGKVTVYVGKLVTSIVLDKETFETNKITLKRKKSLNLADELTVYPITATNQTLKYSTSNKKIVTVNSKGKITAKKVGTAYITISTTDGSNVDKVIEVTVTK